MARTAKPKKEISMEEALWKSADKLRGSVEPAEYKHVVLSLFFLKFAGDKFDAQREMITNNTQHDTTKKRSHKSGSSCYFRGMRGYISISKSSGFRRLPGTAIFL